MPSNVTAQRQVSASSTMSVQQKDFTPFEGAQRANRSQNDCEMNQIPLNIDDEHETSHVVDYYDTGNDHQMREGSTCVMQYSEKLAEGVDLDLS